MTLLKKSKILIRRKPPFLALHPLEKSGIRIFQLLVLTRCKEEPIKRISEPKAAPREPGPFRAKHNLGRLAVTP